MKKYSKRILLGIGVVLLFFLALWLALQTKPVQNFLTDKLMGYLSDKYAANWTIEKVNIDFFDEASFEKILFLDQQSDTLLYADRIEVDIGVFSLFGKELAIDHLSSEGLVSKIYHTSTDTYNYEFLIASETSDTEENSSSEESWTFNIGSVDLDFTKVLFRNNNNLYTGENFSISGEVDRLGLTDNKIFIDAIAIKNGHSFYHQSGQDSSAVKTDFRLPEWGWDISIIDLALDDHSLEFKQDSLALRIDKTMLDLGNIKINDKAWDISSDAMTFAIDNYPIVNNITFAANMDGNRLALNNLLIKTENDEVTSRETTVYFGQDSIVNTQDLSVKLSPELLSMISTRIDFPIRFLSRPPLTVEANQLTIGDKDYILNVLKIDYAKVFQVSGDALVYNYAGNNEKWQGDIELLSINPAKASKILPAIAWPDSLLSYKKLLFDGKFNGSSDSLGMNDIRLILGDDLRLQGGGYVKNLLDLDKITYAIDVDTLTMDLADLPYLPVSKLALDSLGQTVYMGTVSGSTREVSMAGRIKTDLGGMDISTQFSNLQSGSTNIAYTGSIDLQAMDLGTLLRRKDLQHLSLRTEIEGKGFSMKSLDTKLNGQLDSVDFRGYVYRNLKMNASVSDHKIDGLLSIDDENIKMLYDGEVRLDSTQMAADFRMIIDTFLPQELGFYKSKVGLAGDFSASFHLPMQEGGKGEIVLRDYTIQSYKGHYHGDSIVITAARNQDSTFLDISSSFFQAEAAGIFSLQELPMAFRAFARDWQTLKNGVRPSALHGAHGLRIVGEVEHISPLTYLMPRQEIGLGHGQFDFTFDFIEKNLTGQLGVDSLVYNDYFVNSSTWTANHDSLHQIISAEAEGVEIANFIEFYRIKLHNSLEDNLLATDLHITDADDVPTVAVNSAITKEEDQWMISLQDSFVLNSKEWYIPGNNQIMVDSAKVLIDDLTLTDNNELLRINSLDTMGNDMQIKFENFAIDQFFTLLTSKPAKFSGNLNGKVTLEDMKLNPFYLVNVRVSELAYLESKIGELAIEASEDPEQGSIFTTLKLEGSHNNMVGQGSYHPNNQKVDLKLDVEEMEMKLLDPFLDEIISNSEGKVSGKMSMSGPIDNAYLSGEINFMDATTTVDINNTRYRIKEHSIFFDDHIIELNDLPLQDQQGNDALVSGYILHDYFDDIDFYLDFSSDNFVFLNTTSSDNPIFYGSLIMDAEVKINGSPDLLDVNVIASPLKSTDMTMSPFSETQSLLKDDFIRYGVPQDDEDLSVVYLQKIARKYPFKVNLLLDANEQANFKFVIDPITGDYIRGKGNGDLRVLLNPNGTQEMYGNYTVSEGEYAFSYGDFVSKNFIIKEGGNIRFNGDPLDATLDIEAVYRTFTTTYELIKNEATLSDAEANAAKSRTAVEVVLGLSGSLMNPQIKLDIQVPELQSGLLVNAIDRKLNELRNNPDELNNQAFGLLLFDSFLLSSSSSGGSGSIGESVALSSISKLISSQLNRLANNFVRGVNIEFDVNSYNSEYANEGAGGNVTELGLQISKQLFNDRLTIRAGGNVNMDTGNNQQFSSLVGDFVVEYNLTENGTYRIRVFSKADYDRLLNENTNRNGVSLFFNKSFDNKISGSEKK